MSSNFDFLECLDDLLDVAESSELFIEIDMDLDLSIADGGLAFPLPMRAGHGPSALATGSSSGYPSDNALLPHSFPRIENRIMSDASYGHTPSSDANSFESPAPSPLPAPDLPACPVRRSSVRELIPQKPSTANKVSSPQNGLGPSLVGGGPTGKAYTVPPRPKPGRKPATDEPASKRKAQNRESQRAFRARKAAKVQELQEESDAMRQKYEAIMNANLAEIDKLKNDIRGLAHQVTNLAQEREYWKEQFNRLKDSNTPASLDQDLPNPYNNQMLFQAPFSNARPDSSRGSIGSAHAFATSDTGNAIGGCGDCKPDDCQCMKEIANDMSFQPMEAVPLPQRSGLSPMTGIEGNIKAQSNEDEGFEEREIDFTTKFQRSNTRAQQLPTTLMPSNDMSKVQDCGWCEGRPELCLCKDASLRPDGADELAPISRAISPDAMEDIKLGPVINGPGSCTDCQANPKQRAWCQRVAQLRGEATPPLSRRGSKNSSRSRSVSLDVMEPKVVSRIDLNKPCASPTVGERSIGCSDAFKLLDGRVPVDDDHMDWRHLKPISQTSMPADGGRGIFTMEPGMYSAMELDASSILTTLQHASRPLKPRRGDGAYAPLVRIAEERRKAGDSPMAGPNDHSSLGTVSAFNMDR